MLRKFGYTALALFAVCALSSEAYRVSTIPGINARIVAAQDAVAKLGPAAPLADRAMVAFSRPTCSTSGAPMLRTRRGRPWNARSCAATFRWPRARRRA